MAVGCPVFFGRTGDANRTRRRRNCGQSHCGGVPALWAPRRREHLRAAAGTAAINSTAAGWAEGFAFDGGRVDPEVARRRRRRAGPACRRAWPASGRRFGWSGAGQRRRRDDSAGERRCIRTRSESATAPKPKADSSGSTVSRVCQGPRPEARGAGDGPESLTTSTGAEAEPGATAIGAVWTTSTRSSKPVAHFPQPCHAPGR